MPEPRSVTDRIRDCGVVPVVAIAHSASATDLGAALIAGGLPVAEITLRTPAALDAISLLRSTQPDLLVGAGTVLSVDQAAHAIDAGAQFVVMPGSHVDVITACQRRDVPVFPGAITPTEIMAALDVGLTDLKFFPAEPAGGLGTLRALAGPFPNVRFMPTGGIGPTNLAAYLGLPTVLAVGGSWMVRPESLDRGDWDTVRAITAAAVATVRAARPGTAT